MVTRKWLKEFFKKYSIIYKKETENQETIPFPCKPQKIRCFQPFLIPYVSLLHESWHDTQYPNPDIHEVLPEKTSASQAPHDGSLESLLKPQTTVASADPVNLGNLRVPENDVHRLPSEKPSVSAEKLAGIAAQTTEQPSKIVKITQVKNVQEEQPLTGLKKNNDTQIEKK